MMLCTALTTKHSYLKSTDIFSSLTALFGGLFFGSGIKKDLPQQTIFS